MSQPVRYHPRRYDALSVLTMVGGVLGMLLGEYVIAPYQAQWGSQIFLGAYYGIPAAMSTLMLGGLAYWQYQRNKDYLGSERVWRTGRVRAMLFAMLVLGVTGFVLYGANNYFGLNLHQGFMFWPSIALTVFSVVGWVVRAAIKVYQQRHARHILSVTSEADKTVTIQTAESTFAYQEEVRWQALSESKSPGVIRVNNPEPDKQVPRIRTVLAEALSNATTETVTYIPNHGSGQDTLGAFVFKRGWDANGRQYFSLDASMAQTGAESINEEARIMHASYLLKNEPLLLCLSHVSVPESARDIQRYLLNRGYQQVGNTQVYQRKDFMPCRGTLEVGFPIKKKITRSEIDSGSLAIDLFCNLSKEEARIDADKKMAKEMKDIRDKLSMLPNNKSIFIKALKMAYMHRSLVLHPDKKLINDDGELFKHFDMAYRLIYQAVMDNKPANFIKKLTMTGAVAKAVAPRNGVEFSSSKLNECAHRVYVMKTCIEMLHPIKEAFESLMSNILKANKMHCIYEEDSVDIRRDKLAKITAQYEAGKQGYQLAGRAFSMLVSKLNAIDYHAESIVHHLRLRSDGDLSALINFEEKMERARKRLANDYEQHFANFFKFLSDECDKINRCYNHGSDMASDKLFLVKKETVISVEPPVLVTLRGENDLFEGSNSGASYEEEMPSFETDKEFYEQKEKLFELKEEAEEVVGLPEGILERIKEIDSIMFNVVINDDFFLNKSNEYGDESKIEIIKYLSHSHRIRKEVCDDLIESSSTARQEISRFRDKLSNFLIDDAFDTIVVNLIRLDIAKAIKKLDEKVSERINQFKKLIEKQEAILGQESIPWDEIISDYPTHEALSDGLFFCYAAKPTEDNGRSLDPGASDGHLLMEMK